MLNDFVEPGAGFSPQPLDLSARSADTAVPAFIGAFGPHCGALTEIRSTGQLVEVVREHVPAEWAADVLRGFFDEGGDRCYLANTSDRTLQETLAAVEETDEVTILVPVGLWGQGADTAGETVRALTSYAVDHRAMVILYAESNMDMTQVDSAVKAFDLNTDQKARTAVYHPWVVPSAGGPRPVLVPPVGAVVAAWANNDRDRGVWKAPDNVQLRSVVKPGNSPTELKQSPDDLANLLRSFPERGTRIWGSRTLAADPSAPQWAYIQTRRLADMVERDLDRMLRPFVLEANNAHTWDSVRGVATPYLRKLWEAGGLSGAAEVEAFAVRIGQGVTMTEEDVKANRLILEVGIAITRPSEFTTLTVTLDPATDPDTGSSLS
ncbi:phage tail sheath family protein [Streptomyces sp. NPDC101206]|uniref:phage tail sheath family protein n=1 Tax=Streptomyces sp. NPDC101206 TaxID=3366128 RepID=UPI0037F564A5